MYRRLWIGFGLILFLLAILAGSLFYLTHTNELWERRVAAVPHVARSYLRRWRPTPVMPTPPPANALDRARLLQLFTPTTAPSAVPPPTITPTQTSRALPATLTPPVTETAPTATSTPTLTPSPTATPTPTPFPPTPAAERVVLDRVRHTAQMWNNCGPATLTMNLSYYDLYLHQREPASYLKPNPDDKNVSPQQMVAYAKQQGFEALIRVGGTIEMLQHLIDNGYPVIAEDWILPEDLGGMGHYRLLNGYDRAEGYFIAQDSYFGPDKHVPFDEFNHSWRVFNRKYILIYRPEQQAEVKALLGPMADDATMLAHTLSVARAQAQANPDDALSWYSLGSIYTQLGKHELAAAAFDEARRIGLPLRMMWYQFEIFEAYMAMDRYDDVTSLAYAAAYSASGHEEAFFYQGLAYAAQGKPDLAISHLRKAVNYNHNFEPAARALEEFEGP